MRKIGNKIFFLIAILAVSIFPQVGAYNYSLDNRTLSIEDVLKNKVDLFVSQKITSKETANKYITALQKINYERLNSSKQNIYDYLYFKLKNFGEVNKTVNPIKTVNLTPTVSNTNYPDSEITFSSNYEKDYIEELAKNTKDFVSVDSKLVFNRNGKQYLLNLDRYYIVETSKPINLYLSISTLGSEVLFEKGGNFYISKGGYSLEQKLEISDIKSKVLLYSEAIESSLFNVIDGYYYAYNLHKYKYVPISSNGFFLSQNSSNIDLSKSILLYNEGKYYLVIEYETVKLFKSSLLDNISNKKGLLRYFSKDLYAYTGSDIETQFNEIKSKSIELTQNSNTPEEKISNIYAWITRNITYDKFSLDFIKGKFSEDYFMKKVNYNVFTGIGTYKDKNGVCDGYSHLFLYMLYFSGIENGTIETGQALINGKWISHSWNKIGDYYYDSTWDIDSLGDKGLFRWYKTTYDKFFVLRKSL